MAYDPDLALRMINASICAYQIYEAGVRPVPNRAGLRRVHGADNRYFYQVVPEYQDAVGFVEASERFAPAFIACGVQFIDGALVGRTTDGGAVLAIRGTLPPSLETHNIAEWLRDWVEDADMHPVPWRVGDEDWGHVEHGFAKAAEALWPFVRRSLAPMVEDGLSHVMVTGHSKGGAVTYLLAALIRSEWPDLAGRIHVHAFAPALACDARFLAQYDARQLAVTTTRYQVAHDLVPFVPLWTGVDVWSAVFRESRKHRLMWGAVTALVGAVTRGGYEAPGRLVYFDGGRDVVDHADVIHTALPAVVAALVDQSYGLVGRAHSATDSYLAHIAAAGGQA